MQRLRRAGGGGVVTVVLAWVPGPGARKTECVPPPFRTMGTMAAMPKSASANPTSRDRLRVHTPRRAARGAGRRGCDRGGERAPQRRSHCFPTQLRERSALKGCCLNPADEGPCQGLTSRQPRLRGAAPRLNQSWLSAVGPGPPQAEVRGRPATAAEGACPAAQTWPGPPPWAHPPGGAPAARWTSRTSRLPTP